MADNSDRSSHGDYVPDSGEFAAQAPQVLGFTTRAALREALSQRSDGRLQLDPREAP